MLLIRGFDEAQYAQEVNTGQIGCRDFISLVFNNRISGYKLSSYNEPLYHLGRTKRPSRNRLFLPRGISESGRLLAQLLADDMAQETYLSFFHIVEPRVTERWLNEYCNENTEFIYYEPKFLFSGYEFVVGPNYTGCPMRYLSSDEELSDIDTFMDNPGIVALLDFETYRHIFDEEKAQYFDKFNHYMSPLFNRTVDETFNECENEFRLVMRGKRMLTPSGEVEFEKLTKRIVHIDGVPYSVRKTEMKNSSTSSIEGSVQMRFFPCERRLKPLDLVDLAEGDHRLSIEPHFKKIDLRETAVRYGYIGNREHCFEFVRRELYGSGNQPAEDENNHYFHGDWDDHTYVVQRNRNLEEIKGGFRPEGAGFYTS